MGWINSGRIFIGNVVGPSEVRAAKAVSSAAQATKRAVATGATVRRAASAAASSSKKVISSAPNIAAPLKQYSRKPGFIRAIASADKSKALAATSIGVGVIGGLASGTRSTMKTINRAAGNPVGYASSLSVRNAFGGNPEDSRSKRGNASGDITLNSR